MSIPSGKRIVLGVSGSIAAYKAVYLARLLIEAGAEVSPVLTRSAVRFVGPLTFSALCGRRTVVDMWSQAEAGEIGHVELAHRADLVVIAPATADLVARLAEGRAEDPLSAVALATRAPILLAPAMETGMWTHAATQAHVATLRARGCRIVEPGSGELASGRVGAGRMAEPEQILEAALTKLSPKDLAGERLLITAGPTREALDPVRFISNPSTGKMGYALARVAARRGAHVQLISGPTTLEAPFGVELTSVVTTNEMLSACREQIAQATVLVMAAAPADFQPTSYSAHKIKKQDKPSLNVELALAPDILRELAAHKQGRLFVGFAAESEQLHENAKAKLASKKLDLIVVNDITASGAGFAVDTNRVELLGADGQTTALPTAPKETIAGQILDRVAAMLRARRDG